MEPVTEEFVIRKGRRRRRMMHYYAAALHDGATLAAFPERKPSPKCISEHGRRIDADGVLN